jgi:hypothetical protein
MPVHEDLGGYKFGNQHGCVVDVVSVVFGVFLVFGSEGFGEGQV